VSVRAGRSPARGGLLEKALGCLDAERLVGLTMELVNIPSQTGEEKAMALHFREVLAGAGMRTILQEVSPGRLNVLGALEGTGAGKRLMFNGHLDVSLKGTEQGTGGIGYRPEARLVEDAWIYGMGAFNMKGALAAYVVAVEAIEKSGIRLAGDVLIAGVAGEIEKAPVEQYQGDGYQGYGVGTKHLVTHGGLADMCVLGEPTQLRIVRCHMGTVWARIQIEGQLVHTAWSDREKNAIEKMPVVIEALKGWIPDYQRRHRVEGVAPKVNIAAIEGGWPWRASRTPAACSVFLDVRTPPDLPQLTVLDELRGVMAEVEKRSPDLRWRVDLYVTGPGTSVPADAPVVRSLVEAHRETLGVEPEFEVGNWYSDAAHLNRYGVPSVNYGPGGRIRTGGSGWSPAEGEHLHIGDLIDCAKVYVDMILRTCGTGDGA
jgi:acetylornithine deacetylase/succinyl-diaminopimelate desuccinylase-like protein